MNRKLRLKYLLIGIAILFVLIFTFGVIQLFVFEAVTLYVQVATDGLEPTIYKDEWIGVAKYAAFDKIKIGDIILVHSNESQDKKVIQRVLEIVQKEPTIVKIASNSITESLLEDHLISEDEYIGKVVEIYKNKEAVENRGAFRTP